jgi:nitroreductase
MELSRAIRGRRMIRRYDPDRPVPDEAVLACLGAAIRAPSAGFSQGWDFLVLRSPEERATFWSATTGDQPPDTWLAGMATAPALILCLSDPERYLERYAQPDKGWTDRDPARWPVPYWDVDTGRRRRADRRHRRHRGDANRLPRVLLLSVIYARALPDARDGLKPVQRRILFSMSELGLRPDRPAREVQPVVGEVMGKYHPHGDTAIYDALVRLAQPFTMRLPLVDGHGNFGSLDDGPAASRYTEARMAPRRLLMVAARRGHRRLRPQLRRHSDLQPVVLPAAYPNLLVNGAVRDRRRHGHEHAAAQPRRGHRRRPPPHRAPRPPLEDLMKFVPGPDLPGRRADRRAGRHPRRLPHGGRGTFRIRATARIEKLTPREGHRRHRAALSRRPGEGHRADQDDLVQARSCRASADIKDLTDRKQRPAPGHRGQERLQPRRGAGAALQADPIEDSFGINNVALVEGQPRTLGLSSCCGLRRLPHRRRPATHRPPTGQARGAPCTWSRARSSPSSTSTRSSSSSGRPMTRRGTRPA